MKISYPVSPWNPASVGFIIPPRQFNDGQEYRVTPVLRDAAKTRNPTTILARAAATFYQAQQATILSEKQGLAALGAALAGLAKHFRLEGATIQPLTRIGEVTTRIFGFNESARLHEREEDDSIWNFSRRGGFRIMR